MKCLKSWCGILVLVLAGCGGGGGTTSASPEPAATLTLAGGSEALAGGKAVTLTATPSANAGTLAWSLGAGSPGSLSASSGNSVNYLPPAASAVKANTVVTITASGSGVSKSFMLTLYPDPGPAGLSLIAGTPGGQAATPIDGMGSDARFWQIGDVASDAAGNLLVTDYDVMNLSGWQDIRTITPAGKVSTTRIAVSVPGLAGGNGNNPRSITVAPDGTVYFVFKNRLTRLASADPAMSMYATNPVQRVVAGSAGTLYVTDVNGKLISKITADGSLSTFAGASNGTVGTVDGQGSNARFGALGDMTIDKAGNLFVIDGYAIRKITAAAEVTMLAGSYDSVAQPAVDGTGGAANFRAPQAIAVAADGALLVLDGTGEQLNGSTPNLSFGIYSLRRVSASGVVTTIKTGLTRVSSVRVDALGRVLLIGPQQVNLLAANGDVTVLAGMQDDTLRDIDGGVGISRLVEPQSVAVDPVGNLFVIEANHLSVASSQQESGLHLRKIAPDGTATTLSSPNTWWGKTSAAGPAISKAAGVAIDRQGNLYIGDGKASGSHGLNQWGGTIVKVAPDGSFSVFAGKHDTSAPGVSAEGSGEAARFVDPSVTGFDADGNLYINDAGTIRKITPERVVSTVSALPAGFQADADGNQYRMDGSSLLRVAPNGTTTLLAGRKDYVPGIQLGALPGSFYEGSFVRTGPRSFAIVSGSAVLKLVVP
jgi:hypothetical protein